MVTDLWYVPEAERKEVEKKVEKKEPEKKEIAKAPPSELFVPLKELRKKKKLKIGLWGRYETGKTHFIMTCPDPVYIIDTEFGTEALAHKFTDKEIYVMSCFIEDPETGKADPVKSLEQVEIAVNSLRDISGGTIAIDSGSDIWYWEECRMKEIIGEIGRKTMQFDWKIANQHYGQLINKLLSRDAVFVITAREREVYSGPEPTGVYEARWQSQTPYWVDIVCRMEKFPIPAMPESKQGTSVGQTRGARYISTIEKCRFERMFNRQIEDLTYDKLFEVVKPYL